MKKLIPVFFLAVFFGSGCTKQPSKIFKMEDGTYTGTFQRETVTNNNPVARVTLTFTGNQWKGTSDKDEYPALCHGTWSIKGDTLIFKNECGWFANFDWSLILSGKYLLDKTGNNLIFHKDYAPKSATVFRDLYELKRGD